jgi:spore germination protein YaaH
MLTEMMRSLFYKIINKIEEYNLVRNYFLFIILLLLIGLFPIATLVMQQKKTIKTIIPTVIPSNTPPKAIDLKIKSSIPYWDQENAFQSFATNVGKYDFINVFWYYLDTDGKITKYEYANEDENIIAFSHTHNVKVFATLTNLPEEGTWDSDRVERILKTKQTRAKHILDIVNKLNAMNFDGLTIDYESVDASKENKFSLFIEELANALHKDNKLLSVSLHPKRLGDEGLGGFQDWRQLSQFADQMTIMAFDEHYDEGSAGPVASLPWQEKILSYADSQNVPADKIYLGIPLFGYDWNHDNTDAATGLTYADVQNLVQKTNAAVKWNDEYESPYFLYIENGDHHEVWFENAESIKAKLDFAKRIGIAGISFWRLGDEDPKVWELL